MMIIMVVIYKQHYPRWVICATLIVRTASMNCPGALTKAVLMDNVPKNERAKWAALESINMFSWSGSAALGGILVHYHGILFNFCITAFLQFIGTLPLLLLSFFQKKFDEEVVIEAEANDSDIDDDGEEEENDDNE